MFITNNFFFFFIQKISNQAKLVFIVKTDRPSRTRNSGNCTVIKATLLLTRARNLSTVTLISN